eukprot:SAG11_NODE_93_length_17080_cov_10.504093_1_plen_114_part_00
MAAVRVCYVFVFLGCDAFSKAAMSKPSQHTVALDYIKAFRSSLVLLTARGQFDPVHVTAIEEPLAVQSVWNLCNEGGVHQRYYLCVVAINALFYHQLFPVDANRLFTLKLPKI